MRKEIQGRYVVRVKYGEARASQITSSATDNIQEIQKRFLKISPPGVTFLNCTHHIYDRVEQKII